MSKAVEENLFGQVHKDGKDDFYVNGHGFFFLWPNFLGLGIKNWKTTIFGSGPTPPPQGGAKMAKNR